MKTTTTVHAIVTTDRYNGSRTRHDIPGDDRAAAELEARTRHANEAGVDLVDVAAEHHGTTEEIVTVNDMLGQLHQPDSDAISRWLRRMDETRQQIIDHLTEYPPPYVLRSVRERRDDNGLPMPPGWGGGTEVTLWQVIPGGPENGGRIGHVEQDGDGWRGVRGSNDRGPRRSSQHAAVLDVFGLYVVVNRRMPEGAPNLLPDPVTHCRHGVEYAQECDECGP